MKHEVLVMKLFNTIRITSSRIDRERLRLRYANASETRQNIKCTLSPTSFDENAMHYDTESSHVPWGDRGDRGDRVQPLSQHRHEAIIPLSI
jgi:hypothetical protein